MKNQPVEHAPDKTGRYTGAVGRVRELRGLRVFISGQPADEPEICYCQFEMCPELPTDFRHLCAGWHRMNKDDIKVDE